MHFPIIKHCATHTLNNHISTSANMTSKSKISLQTLNKLVIDTFFSSTQPDDNSSSIPDAEDSLTPARHHVILADLKKLWEGADFQKRMALEVFGIKSKSLTPGPKRNKSAYMFFCQDVRQKTVSENASCKPNQIMSILGAKWRDLTTKQKTKYYEQAIEDKERYLDMKELEKRRNKTPNKLSSYFLFCEDERPLIKKEFPGIKTKKVTTECGKRWNDLKVNDVDKYKYYVDKAANLK